MKTIFIKLFLTLGLVTAVANAQAPTVQVSLPTQVTSDTASAAVLTARERLKTIYGVADDQIVANLVESKGKSATVRAAFPGHTCYMSLVKNDAANGYGWLIQNPRCRKN